MSLKSKFGVIRLKIKYIGEAQIDEPNSYKIFMDVVPNKIYDVLSIEGGWYRIVDESGEDYMYPPNKFEVVESAEKIFDTSTDELEMETSGSVAV